MNVVVENELFFLFFLVFWNVKGLDFFVPLENILYLPSEFYSSFITRILMALLTVLRDLRYR